MFIGSGCHTLETLGMFHTAAESDMPTHLCVCHRENAEDPLYITGVTVHPSYVRKRSGDAHARSFLAISPPFLLGFEEEEEETSEFFHVR